VCRVIKLLNVRWGHGLPIWDKCSWNLSAATHAYDVLIHCDSFTNKGHQTNLDIAYRKTFLRNRHAKPLCWNSNTLHRNSVPCWGSCLTQLIKITPRSFGKENCPNAENESSCRQIQHSSSHVTFSQSRECLYSIVHFWIVIHSFFEPSNYINLKQRWRGWHRFWPTALNKFVIMDANKYLLRHAHIITFKIVQHIKSTTLCML